MHSVDNLVRRGRLRVVHRGVYEVGPIIAPRGREMAAILACGKNAAISHRSAAEAWQLLQSSGARTEVDVIIPRWSRAVRRGIIVHRTMGLQSDEVTERDGLTVTTIARTLLDLASVVTTRELERALAQADRKNATAIRSLHALLIRHPRHYGCHRLRALLEAGPAPSFTRSVAEERLLALIRVAKIRLPETNARIAGYEVDFFWKTERLIVEVDGLAFHGSNRSFEWDRRRDAVLVAGGFRVVRVTWHQIEGEPQALLVRLAQALVR